VLSVQTQKFLALCVSDERMQPLTLHCIAFTTFASVKGCGDTNDVYLVSIITKSMINPSRINTQTQMSARVWVFMRFKHTQLQRCNSFVPKIIAFYDRDTRILCDHIPEYDLFTTNRVTWHQSCYSFAKFDFSASTAFLTQWRKYVYICTAQCMH